ncbi:MAG: hypothetical protein PHQ66_00950 [Candidatus Nanoarchaeia archaeon]|nr:hypothetical protein [Candidatus Nanoarchaeia archaeon]MDD5358050.1 hypothetical protein [Candidatus Nanoarchaeia archaeon]MDD5588969.1 hypothetical protein [Candidatus Nanoarchaeia archaeon]
MLKREGNRRAQVTIFIIIAIIIVAGVAIFLAVRGGISIVQIPANIQPVYNTFLSCLEDKTKTGIDLLESQAGYIELPEFEPGSVYMPFSSQLNFLGNPIPYWYYVSANNLQKEQMPSEQDMEKSLESFIDDRIRECDFSSYYQEGFEIVQKTPTANVDIRSSDVNVRLNMNMEITKGEDTALVTSHETTVKSNLGALYNSAKTLYQKEQKELFLEDYAIDNVRLYAPVDGVEISCSPKTWNTNEIFSNLQDAIETNTLALTTTTPTTNDGRYFYVSAGIGTNARFINSKSWAYSIEVLPSQNSLLIANPVGNQQGLGILGFCYVPYHFVYNVKYPVLVQVYNGDEIFQFPVAVLVQGNKPREPLTANAETITPELCPYKNTEVTVRTYDTALNPINSLVSYECFSESCAIGNTVSGILTADFPQCSNGYITARADGYQETRTLFSTIQEGSATIVMNKLYDLNVALKLGGNNYDGKAFIYFVSDDNSKTISYPEQKKVKLSEGTYDVSVYIYRDSSLQLQETTTQECVDVPSSGIGGIFGITEKNCFDVKIPSQLVTNVLAGGGKQEYNAVESQLSGSNTIEINAQQFTTPTTIEQLQNNYLSFDNSGLDITLR